MIAAASFTMTEEAASEVCRNVYMGLTQLEFDGTTNLRRVNYVEKAIAHRVRHFKLVMRGDATCTAVRIAEAFATSQAAA